METPAIRALRPPLTSAASAQAGSSKESLAQAAEEFEAMFAGMLLRMARESSEGGWLGSGEQAGADGIVEFAEQHIARTMAKQGVFGIQQTITQAMQEKSAQPARSTR